MLFAVAGYTPSTRAAWVRILTSAGGPGAACVTSGPWIQLPSAVNGARSPIARSKDDATDDPGPDVIEAVAAASTLDGTATPAALSAAGLPAASSPVGGSTGTVTTTEAPTTSGGPTITIAAAVAGSIGGLVAVAVLALVVVVRKRRLSVASDGHASLRSRVHPVAGAGAAATRREHAWATVGAGGPARPPAATPQAAPAPTTPRKGLAASLLRGLAGRGQVRAHHVAHLCRHSLQQNPCMR
jgi:hypothetical protein